MILAGVKIQVPEMALVSLLPNVGTRAGPLAAIVRPGNSKIFKTFPLKMRLIVADLVFVVFSLYKTLEELSIKIVLTFRIRVFRQPIPRLRP